MLNFILLDDEMQHNLNMEKYLNYIIKKNCIEAVIKLIATEPSQVLKYSIENVDKDNVYLLDVDLGCEINGIELGLKIREHDVWSYIVYISVHPEFVMSCLKVKVFDFLVKPITYEILETCIIKIHKDFTAMKKERHQTLVIKSGFNVYQLNTEEIIYFEKYGHLLTIHTLKGQIRSKESLEYIENKLDKNKFFKCHKSYLVNLNQIAEVDNINNIIYFKNGEYCPFSKRCKKELKMICSVY